MTHLADYVNPYIGTISHMLTSTRPEVLLPYGMARSAPVVRDCGDYYCNDRVVGFPLGATDTATKVFEAKTAVEGMINHINSIVNTAVEGGDPMLVEEPSASCTGSCSSCSGCH